MSILIVDKETIEITVKGKVGESFTSDEEVLKLASEAKSIKKSLVELNNRLTKLLQDCHQWNRKNDEDYENAVQQKLTEQTEVSKKSKVAN